MLETETVLTRVLNHLLSEDDDYDQTLVDTDMPYDWWPSIKPGRPRKNHYNKEM
jgi:hypothetical protein